MLHGINKLRGLHIFVFVDVLYRQFPFRLTDHEIFLFREYHKHKFIYF